MNESDPLIEPVSVNSQTYDESAPEVEGRSVKAPLGPFIGMLVALAVILVALGALSMYVGGCQTDAPACFAASMVESQMVNGTGKWLTMSGTGASVRVLAAAPPTFMLNFLTKYQLLGAWRLFALPIATAEKPLVALANNTDKREPLKVFKQAVWLSSGQIEGQFSRVGFECFCARVVDVSVYQNNTAKPAGLINYFELTKTFNLTSNRTLSAQANAVFTNGNKAYLFVDFLTKTKDDPHPMFYRQGIAVGNLTDDKPFVVPEPDSTFSLSPTAAMTTATDGAKAIYLFFDDKHSQPMLARVAAGEKALGDKQIDLTYFGGVVNKQPSWVALDKAKPLDFGCSVHSVHAGQALCITPTVRDKNATATNELHLLSLAAPWSSRGKAPLMLSMLNETFSSAEWHPESIETNRIAFSTIAIKEGHRSGLPSFWHFEQKPKK